MRAVYDFMGTLHSVIVSGMSRLWISYISLLTMWTFSIYNSSCICDKRTFMATDFPRAYVEFDSHILFDRVWIHVSTSLSG